MTSTCRILTLLAAAAFRRSGSPPAPRRSPTRPPADRPFSANAALVTSGACTGDDGVTIIVDASGLDDAEPQAQCFLTDESVPAADALTVAQVNVEGTEQYGDQVVCRVNGLPSASEPVGSTEDPAYVESCETMPAAFAYWSLWLKPAGGEWDYAQEGLSTLQVEPGDSIELLFTLDGAPAAPAA
ncbi:hypothetical protein [Microbacterium aurum]